MSGKTIAQHNKLCRIIHQKSLILLQYLSTSHAIFICHTFGADAPRDSGGSNGVFCCSTRSLDNAILGSTILNS